MSIDQATLKAAWDVGAPIPQLFDSGPPNFLPEVKAPGPDHPCSGYFEYERWNEGFEIALSHLRDKILNGEWHALGYQAPRRKTSILEIVPLEVCRFAEFDFTHSGITGDGFTFVGVRVVHSSLIPAEVNTPKRKGRPSMGDDIVAIYRQLLEKGALCPDQKITEICQLVRRELAKLRGIPEAKLKGAGIETIRQTLKPVINGEGAQKTIK